MSQLPLNIIDRHDPRAKEWIIMDSCGIYWNDKARKLNENSNHMHLGFENEHIKFSSLRKANWHLLKMKLCHLFVFSDFKTYGVIEDEK